MMTSLDSRSLEPLHARLLAAPKEFLASLSASDWITGGISLLYVLMLWVPWQPRTIPNVDGGWALGLHYAFLHHWDFGSQFVFTYGPWGFVYGALHPRTVGLVILVWSFLAAAFWAGAWSVFERGSRKNWVTMLWVMGLTTITCLGFDLVGDVRLLIFLPLLVIHHFFAGERRATAVVLLIACAWVGLIKFSMLVGGVCAVGVIAIDESARQRRWPRSVVIWVGSVVVLWMLAHQSPLALWSFLRGRIDISTGYTQAMAVEEASLFSEGFFKAAALVALAVMTLVTWERSRRWMALPMLGLIAPLWLAYKSGYVRHDGHECVGTCYLLAFALLLCALRPNAQWRQTSVFLCGALLAASLALFWISLQDHAHLTLPGALAEMPARLWGSVGDAGRRIAGLSQDVKRYEAFMAETRKLDSVPALSGSVDVYPHNILSVLSRAAEWRPRPIIQSYSCYTPRLLEMNAAHLRRADAPESILFDIAPINERFPSLDDSATWPELFSRYDLIDASGSFLFFRRAAAARGWKLTPVSQVKGELSSPIEVPATAGAPIWVSIDCNLNAWGKLHSLVHKAPLLAIDSTLANGQRVKYRLLPGVARSGFLLSPVVMHRLALASLISPQWETELAGNVVKQISVTVDPQTGAAAEYDSNLAVAFSRLEFEHRDVSAVAGLAECRRLMRLFPTLQVLQSVEAPRLTYRRAGPMALIVRAPTALGTQIPPQGNSVHVAFGVLDQGNGAAVNFELGVVTENGSIQRIWSRALDPAHNASDREVQQADVPIGYRGRGLVLNATPVGGGATVLAYWADLDFR